jgi:peptidylprolyl isomerase
VAILFPASIIHKNQGIEELKIGKDDGILLIMEVRKVYLPYAVGNEQAAQSGFPTVIRAVNGVPGVSVPTDAPFPKASKDGQEAVALEVLIQGAGKTIVDGEKVILHYAGYTWSDGAKFDSSWDKGQPANFTLTEGALIPGFIEALVGQKVGSQIVAVIPPALGYGSQAQGTIPSNSTLVFVIDILGVQD